MESDDSFGRNILFGLLAERASFVASQDLVVVIEQWLQDQSQPLDRILLDKRLLDAETHELVRTLLASLLERWGGDVSRSIEELGPFPERLARLLGRPGEDETLPAACVAPHVPLPTKSGDPDLSGVGSIKSSEGDSDDRASRGQHRRSEDLTLSSESQASSLQGNAAFAILRPLATGGLGEVLVARDTALNREVALKRILARLGDDSQNRSRFLLEAEITAGLEHPSIVPIYALGTSVDGRPFYAMRLVQGQTLEDAINCLHLEGGPRGNSVRFRQLLGHMIAVCYAVAYAHSRGVLHRDLKPSNILLGKFGETLLVDWGLAKLIDQPDAPERAVPATNRLQPSSGSSVNATLVGVAVGTPRYMSPEQASGRSDSLGPASDV